MEITSLDNNREQLALFYESLESDTANYLKAKEYEIVQIGNSYLTKMGKIFKEVQDELSNNKNGTFGQWLKAMGLKDDTIRNYINRYNYITENFGDINLIESLPKSLSYEIAKKSAPPQLVQQVLDGEITNHKDYMTEKAKIKAEYEAELAEKDKLLQQAKELEQMQLNRINSINSQLSEVKNAKDKAYEIIQEKEKEIRKAKSEVETVYQEIVVDSPELKQALAEKENELRLLKSKLNNTESEQTKILQLQDESKDLRRQLELTKQFYNEELSITENQRQEIEALQEQINRNNSDNSGITEYFKRNIKIFIENQIMLLDSLRANSSEITNIKDQILNIIKGD